MGRARACVIFETKLARMYITKVLEINSGITKAWIVLCVLYEIHTYR